MRPFDVGPWTWSGETSGSEIRTSIAEWRATPFAHRRRSESAAENQKRSSARRMRTGSLRIPPSSSTITTYSPGRRRTSRGPGGEERREVDRVGAGYLDLPLDGDVRQGRVLVEEPVLRPRG